MPSCRQVTALLLCGLAASLYSKCQTVDLRGGVSQEEDATGGGITLTSSPYSLDIFSGEFGGHFEVGLNLKAEYRYYRLIAGDQPLEIRSSIYGDQARGFYARGGSVSIPLGLRTRATVFGGATGTTQGSSLFEVVRPNQPIGYLQLEHDFNKSLTIFSRSLFSSRQSVISGFDYRQGKRFHLGAQGGIGSNTPYAAVTVNYRNKENTTTLDGSYAIAGKQFQLMQLGALSYQEPVRENAQVLHKFGRRLQFNYHRSNYQFHAQNGAQSKFSGNDVSVAGRLGHTGWSAGYSQSSGNQVLLGVVTDRAGQQVNFGVNQSFGRYHVNALQYQPLSATGNATLQGFTTVMVQEPLGRWVSLRQIASHSSNWGVAYGGEVHNNWVNFSLDYQTTYNLFQPGQSQFQQGAVVEGDVNLPGGTKLFVGTDITPDGRYYYKWGIRASFNGPYHGGQSSSTMSDTPSIPMYVVQGKVVEAATGNPLAEFAVDIGAETVFTDAAGEFSLRLFSGRSVAAAPDTKHPYKGFTYQLVDGPAKVLPVKNKIGTDYIWKVQKGLAIPSTGKTGLVVVSGGD